MHDIHEAKSWIIQKSLSIVNFDWEPGKKFKESWFEHLDSQRCILRVFPGWEIGVKWNAHADTFCILFDCLNIKLVRIQVLLIVASETGHVYSYSTEKFEPVLNTQNGRKMIKSCLENLSIPESKDDSENDARVTTINEKYCQTDIELSGFELYMD